MENLARLNLLIVGANGFIGANLAKYFLKRNYQVSIMLRNVDKAWRLSDVLDSLDTSIGNIRRRKDVKEAIRASAPDILVNAAVYGGYPTQSDANLIFQTNLDGTRNLLDESLNSGVRCYINTGSSSEYGPKLVPMKETDALQPDDVYGVSKAAATLYCNAFARKCEMPIFTFRPFSVFGYYEEATRLVPHLILSYLNTRNPKLSSPNPVRDFVFVEDVCTAFEALIQNFSRIESGSIFNLGSGISTSVGEMVSYLTEICEWSLKPEWGKNKGRHSDSNLNWVADSKKAENLLGWTPKIGLMKGLKKTCDWFRTNKELYSNVK